MDRVRNGKAQVYKRLTGEPFPASHPVTNEVFQAYSQAELAGIASWEVG